MTTVYILIVALLILLNGWFALSEMSVVASHRARLLERASRRRPGARSALRLASDTNRFLSTVQIGITLVGVLAGAFGGATLARPLGHWLGQFGLLASTSQTVAFIIVVTATTYFTLIIGELVPKRIALSNPEWFAALVARPMQWLSRIAWPLSRLLELSTEGVLLCLGMRDRGVRRVTEEEIRTMISEGTHEGVFDPREQAMINGVLRLDDRTVRSVMVPRPNVVWLDIDDELPTVRRKIGSTGSSRFLVCRGEIDELAGVVRTRDILNVLMRGDPLSLEQCMVEPVVVLDSTPIISLLDQFKNARMHMAVVVDEYGSIAGIATMTDVLEVIAGNLPEHWEDASGDAARREDGVWEVNGMMDMEDFGNLLGLGVMDEDSEYHTVAGFVLQQVEHVPRTGERLYWNGIRFEVAGMDGQRIDKLRVTLPTDSIKTDDNAGESGQDTTG